MDPSLVTKSVPLNNTESWKHTVAQYLNKASMIQIALLVLTETHFRSCDLYHTGFPSYLSKCPPTAWSQSIFFQLMYFGSSFLVMEEKTV